MAGGAGGNGSKRRIFIGDVQGCREELERLLERLRFDPAADALYPVGDLVNRGPDSLGSLRLLRDLESLPVLGNHDLHLLHVHAGQRAQRKGDTLADVMAAPDVDELCGWLGAQPFLRVFDDAFMVHAGLHPSWTDPAAVLGRVDPLHPDAGAVFAVRVRHCSARGELPAKEPPDAPLAPAYKPWFEHYDAARHGGRTVVFGHWAMLGLVLRSHLRGLDTGCVWGGKLTAWIAEEDRVVDVAARRAYARIG
jgi:bis(5'-nucleosyl)-tetraphosphatase (symmetrical)